MSCIIYSKLKNIQPGIWSKVRLKASCEQLEYVNCNISDITNDDIIIKQGFGLLLNINNNKYVITCYHIIGLVNVEAVALIPDIEDNNRHNIKLEHVKSIPEFDISILKFQNPTKEQLFYFYTEETLSLKISDIQLNTNNNNNLSSMENLYMRLLILNNLKDIRISHLNVNIENVDVVHEDFIGHIVPKLPLIIFECDDQFENDQLEGYSVEGLSGSQIMKNNIPVGMIMSYNQFYKKFQAMPIVLITHIVKHMINNIELNVSGYNIPTITKSAITKNGQKIYLKYVHTESPNYKTHTGKLFSFKVGHCITSIENNFINNSGKIFCEYLGSDVNIDTFLMLESLKKTHCNLDVCVDLKTEKFVNVKLERKILNTLYDVSIFNNHQYVYWKGLTFVELSEELLIDLTYLYDNNFRGDIMTQFKKYFSGKKYVTIIDVDKNIITIDNCKIINKLPIIEEIINEEKCYSIILLQKIGNKNINGLDDLKKCIKNKPSKKIRAFYQMYENEQIEFEIIL